MAEEAHHDVVLVGEVVQGLLHVGDELLGDVDALVRELQRRDEVLHAGTLRVALDVAQLAHGLHAANLDGLHFVLDQHFFERGLLPHFVVPDLDLDAAIERTALLVVIRGSGLQVTLP